MNWECTDCIPTDTSLGAQAEKVCHHCGKPLCDKHAYEIRDAAVRRDKRGRLQRAVHCAECRRRHHGDWRSRLGWPFF